MHTPDIMDYANSTEVVNRRYADRWGYGFHILDHVIDRARVPHWSKIHVVQTFLPEYDFVFWIDADAAFFDHSRRIEDVVGVESQPEAQMWAQDIWPDFPSLHRKEMIDTGMVLFRNSRWTREFLTEMYYYPECQEHLNWTEQYCFTVAYRADLLGMQSRMSILPTPTLNHHVLPPPENPQGMFVLHLAGRPKVARVSHFLQVHDGRADGFRQDHNYTTFWRFWQLFSVHKFGGVASLQACIFGLGDRHRAFQDALLFHFPYLGSFTIVRQGAPGLWSQMRASEDVGEYYPKRMAHMDINEYLTGKTRDGDRFVQGFYCDVFVLGVESWRHLPSVDILGRMARSGLEPHDGDSNRGFGFSPLRDAYFAWILDGCTENGEVSAPGSRLDGDDEDGAALVEACQLLLTSRAYVQEAVEAASPRASNKDTEVSDREAAASTSAVAARAAQGGSVLRETPLYWSISNPGESGVFHKLGNVVLTRVQRDAFPKEAEER